MSRPIGLAICSMVVESSIDLTMDYLARIYSNERRVRAESTGAIKVQITYAPSISHNQAMATLVSFQTRIALCCESFCATSSTATLVPALLEVHPQMYLIIAVVSERPSCNIRLHRLSRMELKFMRAFAIRHQLSVSKKPILSLCIICLLPTDISSRRACIPTGGQGVMELARVGGRFRHKSGRVWWSMS